MAKRQVTHSGKDKDGDITKLCKPGADWSPRLKAGAISDIDNNVHQYYVLDGSDRVDIHVVHESSGSYLRTAPDNTGINNLDNLPDC